MITNKRQRDLIRIVVQKPIKFVTKVRAIFGILRIGRTKEANWAGPDGINDLPGSFIWNDTKEGYDFWYNIHYFDSPF